MIQRPRLYNKNGFIRTLNPISLSLTMNLTPLSTASIVLPRGEGLPKRSWVELFNPYGSIGMYRVRSPHDAYGAQTTSAELEHMISEVGDYLVKEELDEMMSASTAMKRVFQGYKGTLWQLGSVSALGSGKVALEAKYDRVLDAMLAILEQKPDCYMAFDFSTKPWTVSIKAKPTEVTAECRLARNATSAEISYDDSELCTRVYYATYTKKNGKTTTTWKSKDASTKSTYGLVERSVSTSSDMTSDEINHIVNTYLEEHQEPKVTVRIEAEELAGVTGESMDRFTLGKLLRVVIPDYDVVVEKNITSLTWGDLYNDPRRVTVLLGDEPDTVISFIHNLDSTGSGGGGGGGGGKRKEQDQWKEYYTKIEQTDYNIDLTATKVDKANNILEQAGMKLNSKGVLIYATDTKNAIGSKLKVESDRISLVVRGTGKDASVDAASIVAGINKESDKGSYIKLKAKTINLDGYVTMSKFNAEQARINNLIAGKTYIESISTGNVRSERGTFRSGLTVLGYSVSYKAVTVDGTTYYLLGR